MCVDFVSHCTIFLLMHVHYCLPLEIYDSNFFVRGNIVIKFSNKKFSNHFYSLIVFHGDDDQILVLEL